MMLSADEHPMWVAKQMGYSDWTMIARVYGKWMPAADKAAGRKAESLWVQTPLESGVSRKIERS
jgi:integrase